MQEFRVQIHDVVFMLDLYGSGRPNKLRETERRKTKTNLSDCEPTPSPRVVFPEPVPPDEVAIATSGNVWRKLAINSSPGFCEDVLEIKTSAPEKAQHRIVALRK